MANSSKPRNNLKAKVPAIFRERVSLQAQRRHTPLPPKSLPASSSCVNQVTRSPTVLSDTKFEDQPKSILKQSLCAPTYTGNSQNKSLSRTSEKLLVLKPDSTLDTISYSSYLGMHAFPPGSTVLARESADETTCRHLQSGLGTNRPLQIKSFICNYASPGSCSPALAIDKQNASY